MRFRSIAIVTLLSCAVGSAQAQTTPQDPQCTGNASDVCQQAMDLVSYMVPQLGISVTGGNVTLGQGGALGGLPHFTIGLRANILSGAVPNVQSPTVGSTATRRNPYPTSSTPFGLPAVDASVGLFKGVPLGLTIVHAENAPGGAQVCDEAALRVERMCFERTCRSLGTSLPSSGDRELRGKEAKAKVA